jgi:hypothetical protein
LPGRWHWHQVGAARLFSGDARLPVVRASQLPTPACAATANDFAQSTYRSSGNQLDAFLSFARSKGATRYLLTKDWANFALHYNGTKYRNNNYDTRLAAAYLRFGGTP